MFNNQNYSLLFLQISMKLIRLGGLKLAPVAPWLALTI